MDTDTLVLAPTFPPTITHMVFSFIVIIFIFIFCYA